MDALDYIKDILYYIGHTVIIYQTLNGHFHKIQSYKAMETDKQNTTELKVNNQDTISFFEKDSNFVFAYKKTEKLASAVYLVTNLFSDNEPMKWNLRRKVSDILSLILEYKDINDSRVNDFNYNVKSKVLEIVSMLEISYMSGLVSQMNFNIIKKEFQNLSETFDQHSLVVRKPLNETLVDTFFNVSYKKPIQVGHINSGLNMSHESTQNIHQKEVIKDTISISDKSIIKRSNRQNTILALIKKKKELTIKDISEVIKDCSEKTIQRELSSFIESGVLKRTGERRWSKYSLV